MALHYVVLLAALCAAVLADVVPTHRCSEAAADACQISEVRIDPCNMSRSKCRVSLGSNVTLAFDYTPNFDAQSLKTTVVYESIKDIPFASFGSDDGCMYTPCPLTVGKQQTYTYNLHIGAKLPRGVYPIKWKLWNKDNDSQLCCFKTTISLRK